MSVPAGSQPADVTSFLIAGITQPDGSVRLYATCDVAGALNISQWRDFCSHEPTGTWHLDTDIKDLQVIEDASLQSALARLFQTWADQDGYVRSPGSGKGLA